MGKGKKVGQVERKQGMMYAVDGGGAVREYKMKRRGSAKKTPAKKK